MIDKIQYLDMDKGTYPYISTINVIERIQESYGTINRWMDKIIGSENINKIDVKMEDGSEKEIEVKEVNARMIKEIWCWMCNEAGEILGNDKIITEKEMGRVLTLIPYSQSELAYLAVRTVSDSISKKPKNVETTQNQK